MATLARVSLKEKPSCGRELAKKMPGNWVLQNREMQGRSAEGVCLASSRGSREGHSG